MKKILIILAAGIGSRFGGLKQMEPLGANGEFIIDYSIYDAIKNGFNKIIFIIKEENHQLFLDTIGKRIEKLITEKNIEIQYVYQNNENTKKYGIIPEERVKPLGTAHAILCAKEHIDGTFAIINADDFYGNNAFEAISKFMDKEKKEIGLVGYDILNTLTENGSVKRGICEVEDGRLVRIIESNIEQKENKLIAKSLEDETIIELTGKEKVSMNMISFYKEFVDYIEEKMKIFMEKSNLLKDEFLIPIVISDAIKENITKVNIIKTDAKWVGITYKEDKDNVKKFIKEQVDKNIYPNNIWK